MVQLVVLIATASAVRLIARVRASACFSSIRIGMEPTPNSLASSAILCRSSAKIRIHHPKHHALPGEFGAQGAEFHNGLLRDRATICGKEEDNGFAIHLPQFVVFASVIQQAKVQHLLSLRSRFNCGFQPCAKRHKDCHADQESSHGSRLVQRLACFNPILGSLWPGPERWGRKVAVQPIHAGGERVGTLLLPDCKPASPTPACVVGLVVRETERTILPGGFYVRFSEAPLNCMKIQTTDFQYADNDMEMVQL